jgi:alkylhydroperoxidase family enzyme
MIAELTILVGTAPWTVSRQHLQRAYSASLSEEDILHLVSLASYFGHLNRIADVVAVPLDYDVTLAVPPINMAAQVWSSAPKLVVGRPAIDPARRPATQTALADWRSYVFYRDAPISRRARTLLTRWVAMWLGDGGISPPTDLTVNQHDDVLRAFAEVVTLAPWTVDDATLAPLRAAGFADAAIFDATATITSAGVFSRIEVALAALGT